MRDRDWGRVVFVSSESGLQIPLEMIHYGVTKTAQIALARGFAESLAGTGITINGVLPGPTKSEGVGTFVKQLAQRQNIEEDEMERQFFKTGRPSWRTSSSSCARPPLRARRDPRSASMAASCARFLKTPSPYERAHG